MRLTLVISSISAGGAERVLVLLAQGFLERKHQVSVVTLFGEESDFYTLPKGIKRISLNIGGDSATILHAIWNNLRRLQALRRVIISTQPSAVISFMDRTNVLTLLALKGTKLPVVVTEHAEPSMASTGRVFEWLRRWLYSDSESVVCVSRGVSDYFSWLPEKKRMVIHNPLVNIKRANLTQQHIFKDMSKNHVVAMGRLDYQKGFDLLIEAFSKVARKHLDWDLYILGEGDMRAELELKILRYGLEQRVFLPGRVSDPFPTLRASGLFVMSSRSEGFGNVLIEAMACGLPVISFDCPSGPREIICNGINGVLISAEDVDALAIAMDRLMSDEVERKNLVFHAADIIERFRLEKVMDIWEELLNQIVKKR